MLRRVDNGAGGMRLNVHACEGLNSRREVCSLDRLPNRRFILCILLILSTSFWIELCLGGQVR